MFRCADLMCISMKDFKKKKLGQCKENNTVLRVLISIQKPVFTGVKDLRLHSGTEQVHEYTMELEAET